MLGRRFHPNFEDEKAMAVIAQGSLDRKRKN